MNKYDPTARFIDRFRYAVRFRGPTAETESVLVETDEDGNDVEVRRTLGRKATHVRHFLRELAEYADWDTGEECFPNIGTLALRLAVTRQSAGDTARLASGTEWMKRRLPEKASGRGWRNYHYELRIPSEVEAWLLGKGARGSKKTRHAQSRDGRQESDKGCPVSPASMSEKQSHHDRFPDTNSSGNPSRNSSLNPSKGLADKFVFPSVEKVEGLVKLAREHLSMGEDNSESDRDVIQMWLRQGLTPESIERAIVGLRVAIEAGAPGGFLPPGIPVGCAALEGTNWKNRRTWAIAEECYWKGENKSA